MLNIIDGATDLRSGRSLWESVEAPRNPPDLPPDITADIVIVGGGITGSFLAERLTRRGLRIVVVDRHGPQRGSTAASTALLQWELDAPLIALEQSLGFDRTAQISRRCRKAVKDIAALVGINSIACGFAPRHSIYVAGDQLDLADLGEEHRLRGHTGIQGLMLDRAMLAATQGIHADGALLYPGSAQADPVALARGLMNAATSRGATVLSPLAALRYDASGSGVVVEMETGTQIHAGKLILANGYEMPDFLPASSHEIVSTWALATEPLADDHLWPMRSLVWQASEPYLYMRTTEDGRIIAGGEDEDTVSPEARDALTGAKVQAIVAKLRGLLPRLGEPRIDYAWSGFFGQTSDALPLIGAVPGKPRCFAAFGYGGNGITFSAIAAEMLDRIIHGESDPEQESFAIDRHR